MTHKHQKFQDLANRLITKHGYQLDIIDHVGYNTELLSPEVAVVRSVIGVVVDRNTTKIFNEVLGALKVDSQSKKTLLLTANSNVQPHEIIVVDGEEYQLTNVNTVKPADLVIMYTLDLEK